METIIMGNRQIQEITLNELMQIASIEHFHIGNFMEFVAKENYAFIRYSIRYKQDLFMLYYSDNYSVANDRRREIITVETVRYLLGQGFNLPLSALNAKPFVMGSRDIRTISPEELICLARMEGAIGGNTHDITFEKSEERDQVLILKYKKGRSKEIWSTYFDSSILLWAWGGYPPKYIGMNSINYLLEQNFKVW